MQPTEKKSLHELRPGTHSSASFCEVQLEVLQSTVAECTRSILSCWHDHLATLLDSNCARLEASFILSSLFLYRLAG